MRLRFLVMTWKMCSAGSSSLPPLACVRSTTCSTLAALAPRTLAENLASAAEPERRFGKGPGLLMLDFRRKQSYVFKSSFKKHYVFVTVYLYSLNPKKKLQVKTLIS